MCLRMPISPRRSGRVGRGAAAVAADRLDRQPPTYTTRAVADAAHTCAGAMPPGSRLPPLRHACLQAAYKELPSHSLPKLLHLHRCRKVSLLFGAIKPLPPACSGSTRAMHAHTCGCRTALRCKSIPPCTPTAHACALLTFIAHYLPLLPWPCWP